MTTKVACVGNMNNNMFAIARILRHYGIDAHLFLFNFEFQHFHPAADTFSTSYEGYTHRLDWGDFASFLDYPEALVVRPFKGFDTIIGCGTLPAFLNRAGRALDLLIPYGSEWDLTRFRFNAFPGHGWRSRRRWHIERGYHRFTRHQARGIEGSRYIIGTPGRIPEHLTLKGEFQYVIPPIIDTIEFEPDSVAARAEVFGDYATLTTALATMRDIRRRKSPVIFHHTRHVWTRCDDGIGWKGNDRLIRGFAKFVHGGHPDAALVCTEYGPDVQASKTLARELGIADQMVWLPLLSRREIMMCLALADFGCGEFHFSWFDSGTTQETLCMGRPLLHFRDDALHPTATRPFYPMINVACEDDVADALADFTRRPDHYRAMGRAGREWYLTHRVQPFRDWVTRTLGLRAGAAR
ncbi:hypothetical protein [Magnetospirillum moscoviense]|uniref:Glycosyltransferase n=1 Tax=Magnetospirillum moscoviense TaxID=1437059 RepID=A0A178MWF1_9PROT|nr:hypothetical protein [Magnetospirillum moscoviense]OAN55076.1 hypothetical protein A6A05_00510 [Magnetospirillum moscoviense]